MTRVALSAVGILLTFLALASENHAAHAQGRRTTKRSMMSMSKKASKTKKGKSSKGGSDHSNGNGGVGSNGNGGVGSELPCSGPNFYNWNNQFLGDNIIVMSEYQGLGPQTCCDECVSDILCNSWSYGVWNDPNILMCFFSSDKPSCGDTSHPVAAGGTSGC